MNKKIILIVVILAVLSGLGYWLLKKTSDEELNGDMARITIYFNNTKSNPNSEDCSKVFPLKRIVSKNSNLGKAALEELFKGPTEEEKEKGYISWFSQDTKNILIGFKVENNTAYVNIKDIRQAIPNISSSCGSAEFLAEIENTLKGIGGINRVLIAIEGKPSFFYEWIQIGCSSQNDFCDEEPFKDMATENEEGSKQAIAGLANETILAIKNKDMEKLSEIVSPDKGVRFSPYSHVDLRKDIVFSFTEIVNFFKDEKKYSWGNYDGSGEPIELTPAQYYDKFIYDAQFSEAPQISYDKIVATGNIINNIFESYPSGIVVEYYFPGFDPQYEGMDWKSLNLVFEQMDEAWHLVGIIHGQWTI